MKREPSPSDHVPSDGALTLPYKPPGQSISAEADDMTPDEEVPNHSAADYMISRGGSDYTTFSHLTLGYSFSYLKDFLLYTGPDEAADIMQAGSRRFALWLEVRA